MSRRAPTVNLTGFYATAEECPAARVPEFALSGRSNVGKSSLVNLITRRNRLAYTSKSPGKTRVFTFYEMDSRWNLVDMPGYGFAKVGAAERKRWADQARRYFAGRTQLAGVVQLIDIRVGPTSDDRTRVGDLIQAGHPLCLAMTKADKIARSKREAAVGAHLRALALPLPASTGVVVTSAAERFGHHELLAWITDVLSGPQQDDD